MNPSHAANAVRKFLRTETVIPMHYGTIPILTGTPEQFIAALGDYDGEVLVMEPGETRKFPDRGLGRALRDAWAGQSALKYLNIRVI